MDITFVRFSSRNRIFTFIHSPLPSLLVLGKGAESCLDILPELLIAEFVLGAGGLGLAQLELGLRTPAPRRLALGEVAPVRVVLQPAHFLHPSPSPLPSSTAPGRLEVVDGGEGVLNCLVAERGEGGYEEVEGRQEGLPVLRHHTLRLRITHQLLLHILPSLLYDCTLLQGKTVP